MNTRFKRVKGIGGGLVFFLMAAGFAWGEGSGAPEIKVAFTAGTFSGLNRADATASVRGWVESVTALKGFQSTGEVTLYNDLDALRAAVEAGQAHLVALQSDEWPVIRGTCRLEPLFIPGTGGDVYDQALLLVRKDSGIVDFAQLRDATVAAHNTAGKRLGELWLDHELRLRGFPRYTRFFRRVQQAEKATAPVLSVFFGQVSAALVGRKSFETAAELNPQLNQQLTALLTSSRIVGSVLCVWSEDFPHKQDLISALENVHETVQGRQILTVFRTERLFPYDPIYFKGVEAILGMNPDDPDPPNSLSMSATNEPQEDD